MKRRVIQAKISDTDPDTRQKIHLTHQIFNEYVKQTIKLFLSIMNGTYDHPAYKTNKELYRRWMASIIFAGSGGGSINYDYLINSICKTKSKRHWEGASIPEKVTIPTVNQITDQKGKKTAKIEKEEHDFKSFSSVDQIVELAKQQIYLFDKSEAFPLPSQIISAVISEAIAIIKQHRTLITKWYEDNGDFETEQAEFLNSPRYKSFLKIKYIFDAFEQENKLRAERKRSQRKRSLRWERWDKYVNLLIDNSELMQWREKNTTLTIPPALNDPAKNKKSRLGILLRANPELGALHRTYVETWKDIPPQRPTFCWPDINEHPRFFTASSPPTSPYAYQRLSIDHKKSKATVEFFLLDGKRDKNGRYIGNFYLLRVVFDPRINRFEHNPNAITKKGNKKPNSYYFLDPRTKKKREAHIKGCMLFLKKQKTSNHTSAYLTFNYAIERSNISEQAKKVRYDEKAKGWKAPIGAIVASVDMMYKEIAFVTIAEKIKPQEFTILASRKIKLHRNQDNGFKGPQAKQIEQHQISLRDRKRNLPRKQYPQKLQNHLNNMREEFSKRSARRILDFVMNLNKTIKDSQDKIIEQVDVILLERLKGLKPQKKNPRGLNRVLSNKRRPKVVTAIQEGCEIAGISCREIMPHYTSQICSKCGKLGRRFYENRKDVHEVERKMSPFGGKLFICPHCGYQANAEFNATINLLNIVLLNKRMTPEDKTNLSPAEKRNYYTQLDDLAMKKLSPQKSPVKV